MTSMEEQLKCFYLDGELKPASDMLRKCVGDETSPYRFNCEEDPMKQVMPRCQVRKNVIYLFREDLPVTM